jgi:large subunit ribosomal protein L4
MAHKALATALSAKLRDGEILFVEDFGLDAIKTSDAAAIVQSLATVTGFEKLAKARTPKAMLVIPKADRVLAQSFRNIPQVEISLAKDLNTLDVLNYKYVIVLDPAVSSSVLEKRCAVISKK